LLRKLYHIVNVTREYWFTISQRQVYIGENRDGGYQYCHCGIYGGNAGLGDYRARKLHQGEYHLAGRSLNLILFTGTFCATVVDASATVDMARLGFNKGLPGGFKNVASALVEVS
jgi:hypothetical protein